MDRRNLFSAFFAGLASLIFGKSSNGYEPPRAIKSLRPAKLKPLPVIRVWKLGYYNELNPLDSIVPTKQAFEVLKKALAERDPEKDFDLVWGPELDVISITPNDGDIHLFAKEIKREGNTITIQVINDE